ncbi:MAG: Zn-dependent protease-like protein [Frankiales bacterium]|nr:Zn-dependent protease-like protein [Frankiales bacterium]
MRIGSVAGVPILLTPIWFLLPAYLVVASPTLVGGSGQDYVLSVTLAVMLLVSVVLHELGHCLVARAFGLPVRSITISLLAGYTEITEPPDTPAREYAVAVAGPMVSLLLTSIAVAAAGALTRDSLPWLLLEGLAVVNGVLAALNLLPGLPLDGGRVLRSIVWQLVRDEGRATRFSARAGMVIALVVVPFLIVGVLPAAGYGDRGPLTIVMSSLVGAYIYLGAMGSLRRGQLAQTLPTLTVSALARPALAVPATTPLSEAVRMAHEQDVRALVVVDGSGRLEGVVSETWVRQVPVERRPWVVVADGARRMEKGLMLDPDLSGQALLDAMQATPAAEYVVAGPVPAVLVSGDVAAAMQS